MKKHLTSLFYFLLIFLTVSTPFVVNSYKENYVTNGIVDKEQVQTDIITSYNGTYEFYYNKFIVSDNIDIESIDKEYLDIKESWKKLGKGDGYASCRILVYNLNSNDVLKFVKYPSDVAFRVFVNKALIAEVGQAGKTVSDTKAGYSYSNMIEYDKLNDDVNEIVIEVGYNHQGGLLFSPSFTTTQYKDLKTELYKHIAILIIILLLVLIIVEFVSFLKIYDSTVYTFYSISLILLTFIFNPLTNYLLTNFNFFISPHLVLIFNFIFYSLFLFSMHFFIFYTYKEKLSKKHFIIDSVFILIIDILYIILIHFNLEIIPFSLITLAQIISLIIFTYKVKVYKELDPTFYHIKCIIYYIVASEIILNLLHTYNLKVTSATYTLSLYIFVIITYFLIYTSFLIRTYKQALNGFKLEITNKNLETMMLKDQIKPHFIFNALLVIKTLYHTDIDKADKALDLFSKNLRFNVNTCNTNLIEFNKELDNIYNFIELTNLLSNKPYNVIYNIEYDDFLVPILSIEPFIENSIKYSNINNMDEGYIEISSYLDNDNIIVEISDNGIGFDIKKLKEGSTGLKNASTRFKYLLNADILIDSKLGHGVSIKIIIPKGGNNENNNS